LALFSPTLLAALYLVEMMFARPPGTRKLTRPVLLEVMDIIATAKELLGNPQAMPWIIFAVGLIALQGAASRLMERLVGHITAASVTEALRRLTLFFLIIHSILGVFLPVWCLIFTSLPSPAFTPETGASTRATNFILSSLLSFSTVLFATISGEVRRQTASGASNVFGATFVPLVNKCIFTSVVLSLVFASLDFTASEWPTLRARAESFGAFAWWYSNIPLYSTTILPLLLVPSYIVRSIWRLTAKL
jgi:hypothetical protein